MKLDSTTMRRGLFLALVTGTMAISLKESSALPPPTPVVPTGTPTPPPSPGGSVLTPVTMDVEGIAPGAAMSVVDAKCKTAGVKCKVRTRKFGALTLDKTIMDFTSGSYGRAYITGKGGTVLSVKGRYRTDDANRVTTLQGKFGKPVTIRRGLMVWTPPGGIVVSASPRVIHFTHVAAAAAKGVAVTPQSFTNLAPQRVATHLTMHEFATAGPSAAEGATPGVIRPGVPLTSTTPTVVIEPLQIPVKIKLRQLECYDPQDPSTVFYGDSPYLNIWGTHTTSLSKSPWHIRKSYEDIDSGDIIDVNQVIFDDGDPRRYVSYGEVVGVEYTLMEGDSTSFDDEIDYGYPIIDYAYAATHQNMTVTWTDVLEGNGGSYGLTYTAEIGVGVKLPASKSNPNSNVRFLAGSYSGFVGDQPLSVDLSFAPSAGPAFPEGQLGGFFREGSSLSMMSSVRLQYTGGYNADFGVQGSSGTGKLTGYFLNTTSPTKLVGTFTSKGVTRGVTLTKK